MFLILLEIISCCICQQLSYKVWCNVPSFGAKCKAQTMIDIYLTVANASSLVAEVVQFSAMQCIFHCSFHFFISHAFPVPCLLLLWLPWLKRAVVTIFFCILETNCISSLIAIGSWPWPSYLQIITTEHLRGIMSYHAAESLGKKH